MYYGTSPVEKQFLHLYLPLLQKDYPPNQICFLQDDAWVPNKEHGSPMSLILGNFLHNWIYITTELNSIGGKINYTINNFTYVALTH